VDAHDLRDHRRNHAQELGLTVEVTLRVVRKGDAEAAGGLAVELHWEADEAELLLPAFLPHAEAVEEERLVADARHDHGHTGVDDLTRDTLTYLERSATPHLPGNSRGSLETKLPAGGVERRDGAADRAVALFEDLEHARERGSQVESGSERLAHLEQRGKLPDLPVRHVALRSAPHPRNWPTILTAQGANTTKE
jgi:hypothetical protein